MPERKSRPYRGDGFTVDLPEDWRDTTIHTLEGPAKDGIQHNILITAERDLPFETAVQYAESQISSLESELKGYRLLDKGPVTLDNGLPGHRIIFSWQPSENLLIYQHQMYVLVDRTGYKLTATFSKTTYKTLGPAVQGILMSFRPE